jgi:hypothetical protein
MAETLPVTVDTALPDELSNDHSQVSTVPSTKQPKQLTSDQPLTHKSSSSSSSSLERPSDGINTFVLSTQQFENFDFRAQSPDPPGPSRTPKRAKSIGSLATSLTRRGESLSVNGINGFERSFSSIKNSRASPAHIENVPRGSPRPKPSKRKRKRLPTPDPDVSLDSESLIQILQLPLPRDPIPEGQTRELVPLKPFRNGENFHRRHDARFCFWVDAGSELYKPRELVGLRLALR